MAVTELELVTRRRAAAPPERVWSVLTDAVRWPEWSAVVEAVTAVPTAWAAGERLAFTLSFGRARVGFNVRLVEVVPPERVAWTSVRWTVTGTRTHTLTVVGGDTEIADSKRFSHPFWPLRWAYPAGVIRRMSETWLDDLVAASAGEPPAAG